MGILADHRHGLGRRDVVAGRPVWFFGTTIEIFFDNLLSPRKFVAPTHEKIMARQIA